MAALRDSALVAPARRRARRWCSTAPHGSTSAATGSTRRAWRPPSRARADGGGDGVDDARLADGLTRLFGAAQRRRDADVQRVAALTAVCRRFCVISGGPGTGKTHTVVRILAWLVEQALAPARRRRASLLLAPTGKAAARLHGVDSRRHGDLPCAAAVRARDPR